MKNNPPKKKRRGCLGLCVSIVVVLLLVAATLLTVSHGTPQTEGLNKRLTILTYNTHRMGMYAKADKNRVIRYLQRQDADIVFLQEVEVYKDDHYLTLPELRQAMSQYPYSYYDFKIYNKRRQYGIVVYSKYPLIHKQTIRYTSRGNISNFCDAIVGEDTIRLFNNHLESNRLVVQDLPNEIETESVKSSAQHVAEKLQSARAIRKEQTRIVRQTIQQSPYPVIVAGDFNAIPLSRAYLTIRNWQLRDCFLSGSKGRLGWTLSKHGLGARIDYILCSRIFRPAEFRVEKVNYSDHYPCLTTLYY